LDRSIGKRLAVLSGMNSTLPASPSAAAATALQKSGPPPCQVPVLSFRANPATSSLMPQRTILRERTSLRVSPAKEEELPGKREKTSTERQINGWTTDIHDFRRMRTSIPRCISEGSAEIEITCIIAPVSMTKGEVQGTEDRVVADKDASGQPEVAEVELLLFRPPYVAAFQ